MRFGGTGRRQARELRIADLRRTTAARSIERLRDLGVRSMGVALLGLGALVAMITQAGTQMPRNFWDYAAAAISPVATVVLGVAGLALAIGGAPRAGDAKPANRR